MGWLVHHHVIISGLAFVKLGIVTLLKPSIEDEVVEGKKEWEIRESVLGKVLVLGFARELHFRKVIK